MSLGEKVRLLREKRQMSTTELAKATKLSQSFISDIENGRRNSPTMKTIERLAIALRVPPQYFFDDAIVTPFDVTDKIDPTLAEFLLNQDWMPILKVTKEALDRGLDPALLTKFIETALALSKSPR